MKGRTISESRIGTKNLRKVVRQASSLFLRASCPRTALGLEAPLTRKMPVLLPLGLCAGEVQPALRRLSNPSFERLGVRFIAPLTFSASLLDLLR